MLTMKTSISEVFQQVKQTTFENDIGTADLPQGKEMDCMILQDPLQPQLPMTAWILTAGIDDLECLFQNKLFYVCINCLLK